MLIEERFCCHEFIGGYSKAELSEDGKFTGHYFRF
jgi:hypothetical protein